MQPKLDVWNANVRHKNKVSMETDCELMRQMGGFLKMVRERVGLSQGEAAQAAGVRRCTYSNWESGRHLPNMLQQRRLLQAFDCSGHELIFGGRFYTFTMAQRRELTTYLPRFSDDLRRKIGLVLVTSGTSEADKPRALPSRPIR